MAEPTVYAAFNASTRRCVTVTLQLSDAVEHLQSGHIVRAVSVTEARAIWGEVVPDLYQVLAPDVADLLTGGGPWLTPAH